MNKIYLLEQKISTLEIILESLIDELIDQELLDQLELDSKILTKIKHLNNQIEKEKEKEEIEIIDFPYWGEKGEA
jgi:hypothetical protein